MKKGKGAYFPKLETEILLRGILKKEIEDGLCIAHSAFVAKLNGERVFTLEQGIFIWKTWFSDIPIDELFRKNESEE